MITNFGSLYAGHVDLVWKVVDLAVVGKRLVVVAAHKGVAAQAGLPGEPEAGPAFNADHGTADHLSAASSNSSRLASLSVLVLREPSPYRC